MSAVGGQPPRRHRDREKKSGKAKEKRDEGKCGVRTEEGPGKICLSPFRERLIHLAGERSFCFEKLEVARWCNYVSNSKLFEEYPLHSFSIRDGSKYVCLIDWFVLFE